MSTAPESGATAGRLSAVLVLGTGFVGSMIAAMASEGRAVSVLSRSANPELASPGEAANALIRHELARIDATAVVNCVGLQRGTTEELTAANVTWPRWLANEVLPGTGCRFVHLGSAAEYGDPGSASPISESATVNPQGAYGETKLAGTAAVLEARAAGLDAVVGRGFNFVGRQLPEVSPLHQFLTAVSALGPDGGAVEVWWPETIRDFILVDDLAEAVMGLTHVPEVPDLVNLCSGVGVAFADVVHAIAARQAKPVEIVSLHRPGIPVVVGDNSRLVSLCGIKPLMSAEIVAEHAGVGGGR